ncbi:hypothetical protein DaDZ19_15170 [Dickeya ananatis]
MTEQTPHSPDNTGHSDLRRNLTNRHIQLIAIGGAIGTGLFMGSGKTISLAGPSIIFVYMIIGFMLFFVMRAMGELLLSDLNYKSFSDFAADLLGPWAGFFYRLDILVLLGGNWYCRCRRHQCLCTILVTGFITMD